MFLQFYGLNEQPFGVTPDPRFLYMGPAHQEAFASLVYGVETGRGFMALIAPPGLGKTTLVLRLMEKLHESALTAFLFQTHTDSKEFLKNLLLDLDAEPVGEDLSDLQAQLHELLIQCSRAGKRLVLVIDEAQNLDDSVLEMIRMLSNFETAQAKLLQTVLVGQPALADKLARPHLAQLRQRISIITHFPFLRGDEVEKYIQHRLRVAGYKGTRLFAPDALTLIARYSKGVPRVINNLCFHALSLGYAKNLKKIDVATMREVTADLSLESLGTRRSPTAQAAGQRASAEGADRGPREKTAGAPPTSTPVTDIGSQPMERSGDPLDRVEFTDYSPDWTGGADRNPSYAAAGNHRPHAGSRYRLEILVALVIAAVAICAWRDPLLKPSLDFLAQTLSRPQETAPTQESLPASRQLDKLPPGETKHVAAPAGGRALRAPAESVKNSVQKANSAVDVPSANSASSPAAKLDTANTGPAPEAQTAEANSTDSSRGQQDVANAAGSIDEQPGATNPPEPPDAPSSAPNSAASHVSAPLARVTSKKALGAASYTRGGAKRNDTEADDSLDDLGARGLHGKLIVQSSVRGAHITINGRNDPRWVTPHYFSLVAGTYIVSVSMEGHSGWTQRVHVDEGREKWIVADLTNDENGVLTVETEPSGMQVFIDGRPYGASRVVTVLQAGWHICEVVPPAGIKPLVGKFHLDPGEALTRRIQVTRPNAAAASNAQQVRKAYDAPRTATTNP